MQSINFRRLPKAKYAILCVVIVIALNLLPIPYRINETIPCTVFDTQDPTYQSKTSVGFIGTYYDSRILADSFKGSIRITHPDLFNIQDLDCKLTFGEYLESTLMQIIPETGSSKLIGFFYGMEDRDQFIFWILAPDENKPGISHGRYFVTNTDMTMDEIYAVINQVKING